MDPSSENINDDVLEFLRCCETLLGHAPTNAFTPDECRILAHYAQELEVFLQTHCGQKGT